MPAAPARVVRDAEANPDFPTWRAKVARMPPVDATALRPALIRDITGSRGPLAEHRFDRSLVQMVTVRARRRGSRGVVPGLENAPAMAEAAERLLAVRALVQPAHQTQSPGERECRTAWTTVPARLRRD